MSRKTGLRLLLLLAAACVLLLGAREARACSCARTQTVLEAYEETDVVVVVRVVSLKKVERKAGEAADAEDARADEDGVVSTEMAVERVYKGGLKPGDAMTFGQGGGADCIWTFDDGDVGRRFLFYLDRPKGGSLWYGVTCSRSRVLDHADDDLLYLNNLGKTRGRSRVSGTLRSFDDAVGVAGRKVRITDAAGKTREVKTNERGVYELYDLPAGKYAVEAETPAGWKIGRFWLRYTPSAVGVDDEKRPKKVFVQLADKRHAGLDLVFEIDNAVRGKVYDPVGRPMNEVCLKLVPADGSKGAYLADCTENGGAFEIDEIPPGRYVLVVNDDGEVTSREPFGTFYHPNVARREEATVFQIGAGDFVEDVNVYAPKVEETFTVEGLFLYADGKPVADETVVFETEPPARFPPRTKTDAKGRFSLKILKGQQGQLRGEMYTYVGEFENCPKLDEAVRQSGDSVPLLRTPALDIRAASDLRGIELRYPFPGCKKSKRER